MTSPDAAGERSGWERGFELVVDYGPYLTLALGSVLALISPAEGRSRLVTIGLATVALAWVYTMFTRAGPRLESQLWVRVYFTGLILLSAIMMLYNGVFFVFVITGFFHSYLLKPAPVGFLGVMATSLVVNSMVVWPDPTPEGLWIYGIVVVVQTLAIGFGIIGGEKITELSEARRQAVQELEKALAENEGLQTQLMVQAREAGISDERQRLAREIHDTIAQGLVGVITQLEAADNVIEDRPALERHIDNALRIARDSLDEARRVVRAERPRPLEGNSLPEAIEDVVERWRLDNPAQMSWSVVGEPVPLHPEIEVTLLRVVQESLANVARHSGAGRVGVTLSYIGDMVTIDVRDDGKGFETNEGQELGFGLRAMQVRVAELAGALQIESEPGRGSAISATIPAGTERRDP